MHQWFPKRLADTILTQANVDHDRRAAELSRDERDRIVQWSTSAVAPITGTLGFEKAEVTTGVSVGEPFVVDSQQVQD